MGGEWKVKKLGSIIDITSSKRIFAADYTVSGVPFYRSKEIIEKHNGNNISTELFISKNKFDVIKSQFGAPKIGDILLTSVGTIGIPYLIQKHEEFYFKDGNLTWLKTSESEVFPKYVYYWLTSPMTKQAIYEVTIGSTQQALTIIALKSLEIPFPSSAEQKSIAHILGTLDEKIELNRQMNQTLEAMAQVLFKSWFVDFDPVIDNALAAGNPIPEPFRARAIARQKLGNKRELLPEDVQKLFPNSFVLTEEMRWIPEGWEASSIGNEIENVGGGTPSTNEISYWKNGTYPFCTPKDMSSLNSIVMTSTERCITDVGVKKISSGLLPQGTVLLSSRAPIGYVAISEVPITINQGIIALLPNEKYNSMFLLNWVHFNLDKIKDHANGSIFLEISKKNFRPISFLAPNNPVVGCFNMKSQLIYNKLLLNSLQLKKLVSIRDTLLPKLISGEIRIQNNVIDMVQYFKDKARENCEAKGYADIRSIAADVGVLIVKDQAVNKARIVLENGQYVIHASDPYDNFSIAHELIHFARDKDRIMKQAVGRKDQYSLNKETEFETEALASEILMPEEYIRRFLSDFKVIRDQVVENKIIRKCANQFGVSDIAMNYRLKNLGYRINGFK